MEKKNIILALMLVLFMCACQQKKVWNTSKTENTIESYQNYLTEYPNGKYADSANIKIELIKWNQANTETSIRSLENYLTEYPTGLFSDDARARIAEVEWDLAYTEASLQSGEVILTKSAGRGTLSVIPYGREKLITIFNPEILGSGKLSMSYQFEKEAREDLVLMAIYTEANIAAMTGSFHYYGRSYEMLDKTIELFLRPESWVEGKTKVTLYFLTPEDNKISANKTRAASNVISVYIDY